MRLPAGSPDDDRLCPLLAGRHVAGEWGAGTAAARGAGTSTTRPTATTSTWADWQVIDLAGAAEHEDLCEAALFYLLERLRLSLEHPDETARVKLMVVDEAWRYLRDPAVLAYLAEAAKTWREEKRGAHHGDPKRRGRDRDGWGRGAP